MRVLFSEIVGAKWSPRGGGGEERSEGLSKDVESVLPTGTRIGVLPVFTILIDSCSFFFGSPRKTLEVTWIHSIGERSHSMPVSSSMTSQFHPFSPLPTNLLRLGRRCPSTHTPIRSDETASNIVVDEMYPSTRPIFRDRGLVVPGRRSAVNLLSWWGGLHPPLSASKSSNVITPTSCAGTGSQTDEATPLMTKPKI